jgi:hypothetical protein
MGDDLIGRIEWIPGHTPGSQRLFGGPRQLWLLGALNSEMAISEALGAEIVVLTKAGPLPLENEPLLTQCSASLQ